MPSRATTSPRAVAPHSAVYDRNASEVAGANLCFAARQGSALPGHAHHCRHGRPGLLLRAITPQPRPEQEFVTRDTCPVSRFLLTFSGFRFEGWVGQVGVEGALPGERFVGADGVVFVDEVGDTVGEVDAAGDLFAVEAFVFQGLEPAFDDAVGPRGAVAGAHVGEVCPGGEPARQRSRFHGRAVVGHDHERRDLAGGGVGAVLDEWAPQQRLGGVDGGLAGRR